MTVPALRIWEFHRDGITFWVVARKHLTEKDVWSAIGGEHQSLDAARDYRDQVEQRHDALDDETSG